MRAHAEVYRDDARNEPGEAQWVVDVYDADDPMEEEPAVTLCWYYSEHEARVALLRWCGENGASLVE